MINICLRWLPFFGLLLVIALRDGFRYEVLIPAFYEILIGSIRNAKRVSWAKDFSRQV